MKWMYQLVNESDFALGLLLSVILGGGLGLAVRHPIGHVLLGSPIGVTVLAAYLFAYSLGTIWLVGVERGLLVVSAFAWCIILSAWLSSNSEASLLISLFA